MPFCHSPLLPSTRAFSALDRAPHGCSTHTRLPPSMFAVAHLPPPHATHLHTHTHLHTLPPPCHTPHTTHTAHHTTPPSHLLPPLPYTPHHTPEHFPRLKKWRQHGGIIPLHRCTHIAVARALLQHAHTAACFAPAHTHTHTHHARAPPHTGVR